jgi:heptaprenyl diphosphate synthase
LWSKYPEIEKELQLVEEYVKKNIRSRNKLMDSIVHDLVEAGGKRLRPALVIIASKIGKYNRKKIIPMAGAFEILHTATLVHDDIIDHARHRRMRRTVYDRYGSDIAIYTGDFLFTKAVLMLSAGIPTDQLGIVAQAIKIMCEGEVDQYQDRFNLDISISAYLKRINRKTAVLFSAACASGGYLAKCPVKVIRSLSKFGSYYGMAFQIRDDLKDFLSDEKSEGKPVGHDILKGNFTLPTIYTINRNSEARKLVHELSSNQHEIDEAGLIKVYDLIRNQGGIEYTRNLLNRYIERGIDVLERIPNSEYRQILHKLLTDLAI